MDRVKFYSVNDITFDYYLKESEKVIKEYREGREIKDINDILELFNSNKYLFYSKTSDIECAQPTIKFYKEIIARYMKSLDEGDFSQYYETVDIEYKQDFWTLVEQFKVYQNLSHEYFKEFIDHFNVSILKLLKCKNLVKNFGEIIKKYMLSKNSSAEILLDYFEIEHTSTWKTLFFPKELSIEDKENILDSYIDSKKANLNYLRLISNIQSNKTELKVSPEILLKARRRAEEKERQLFQYNTGVLTETKVMFSYHEPEDETMLLQYDEQSITIKYDKNWIMNNNDFPTILNNFIYLFDFVDLQMRTILVSKINEIGALENVLLTSSKKAYKKGVAFKQKDSVSLMQMMGYYNLLFENGIRLEEVIEWFFKEYLEREFNVYGFKIKMPSTYSTMLEKCTSVMPAVETVLRQFSIFVQKGEIDFDLLEVRSEHLIYKDIPSLIEKKYVYGLGDEYKKATFLLFSDQSGLRVNHKNKEVYENYFELLCSERVRKNDYPTYNISKVNWLIEYGFLSVDEEGYVWFRNKTKINILKDLYFNEVISYWKYSCHGRKIIDDLGKSNIIEFESSLFSRPEQHYINYLLNKAEFNDGLDLRNKYSHIQPLDNDEEQLHYQNYMVFLRHLILSVIKINDEFCMLEN